MSERDFGLFSSGRATLGLSSPLPVDGEIYDLNSAVPWSLVQFPGVVAAGRATGPIPLAPGHLSSLTLWHRFERAPKCRSTANSLGWKRGQSHALTPLSFRRPRDRTCGTPGGSTTCLTLTEGPSALATPMTIHCSRCASVNPFCSKDLKLPSSQQTRNYKKYLLIPRITLKTI